MKNDHNDRYPDSVRENWKGIAGIFALPLVLGIAGYLVINYWYPSDIPMSNSAEVGVGGAPPTDTVLYRVDNDFLVYDSNLSGNTISGFISKNAYDREGRVFINIVREYRQECIVNGQAVTETNQITLSKQADNYSADPNGLEGYKWDITLSNPPRGDLCPDNETQETSILNETSARIYISGDGGTTTMSDPITNLPYEIELKY